MSVEHAVSRVLAWGGLFGLVLMLVGSVGYAVHRDRSGPSNLGFAAAREHGLRPPAPVSPAQIRDGLRRWPVDPLAVAALGILVLVLTPVGGLAVAVPCFWREGDTRYAAIAGIVLSAVLLSLFLGTRGG